MFGIIGMGTFFGELGSQKTELSCLQHSCVSLKWQFNATCFVFCERWLAIRGESELTAFEAQNECCAWCCLCSVAWVVYLFCRTRSVYVAHRLICGSIYLGEFLLHVSVVLHVSLTSFVGRHVVVLLTRPRVPTC